MLRDDRKLMNHSFENTMGERFLPSAEMTGVSIVVIPNGCEYSFAQFSCISASVRSLFTSCETVLWP